MELKQEELSLLDVDFNDIEDLPGFEVPVPGDYLLMMKAEIKEVNDRTCVELGYEVKECQKKNNDEDPDTPAGTKFSQLFALTGTPDKVKVAKAFLKQALKGVAESLGEGNLLILVRDHLAPGIMVTATVNRRKDKEDPEKFYPVVKNIMLA